MKTKIIFFTKTNKTEQWTDLPFIPRVNEWINVQDILREDEIATIKQSAHCWSGIHSIIHAVEYRHDDNDFYVEIKALCEDTLPKTTEQTFRWNFTMNLLKFR